jgi:aryl-alcohol dehydrogenase-like predicted oxidoreductase
LRKLGIGFVPYSPLGRGFLTGEIKTIDDLPADDRRRMFPRFSAENFDKNLHLVNRIRELAKERGVTPAQLALAWVMARGSDFVPIPGTKRRKYLEENAGASSIKLTPSELAQIDHVAPKGVATGDRYADMRSVNR